MSGVDDLKNQRDLLIMCIKNAEIKLKEAVDNNTERLVIKRRKDFAAFLEKFELVHAQYITKKKGSVGDPEFADVYSEVQETASAVEELLDGYDFKLQEEMLARNKRALINAFNSDMKRLMTALEDLGDAEDNSVAYVQELEFFEKEYYSAAEKFAMVFELEKDEGEIEKHRSSLHEAERMVRRVLLKMKKKAGTPISASVQLSGSRSSSPSRSQALKTKRMEFPKFDGSIRNYITFRRDFKETVEQSRDFTESQMSQILRHECLKDEPKSLVANVYEYHDVWKKLDDRYHDEPRVVELVTHELFALKVSDDEDYETFIRLVDKVERAQLDLSAMGNTTVLNHPMTTALILEKCPTWIRKEAVAHLNRKNASKNDEFSLLLELLLEKRKEARRLQYLGKAEVKKKNTPTYPPQKKSFNNSGRTLAITEQNKTDGAGAKKSEKDYKCITPGCGYKAKHMLSDCRAFKRMTPNDKGKLVVDKKLCKLCFASNHDSDSCPRKATWKPCDIDNCGKWHSRLLHGATASGTTLTTAAAPSIPQDDVLLLVQNIPTAYNTGCTTLWDTGSSVSLVSMSFAEKAGLSGIDCSLDLGGVKGIRTDFQTKLYGIDLVDKTGTVHKIFAFGIDQITSSIPAVKVENIEKLFPEITDCQVNRDESEVDLLIGMQESSLQPVRISTEGKLTLYSSCFGTGYILGGTFDSMCLENAPNNAKTLLLRSSRCVKTIDFLSAENLGVEIPKRCKLCMSCKECTFKSHQLTWRENCELTAIEEGLSLDTVKKVWICEYPFSQDPTLLSNNYTQVLSCMKSLEKRLIKVSQLEAFNDQFEEAVRRGVFRKVTDDEMKQYTGPINYISIVEAYKPGPHVTTPIRLCMNSSLKYRGLSLNDLLMKGPSSLNDIFSVMLGFRRYQVGLVLDISKFYQSVVSCTRDQHLRRVLWRGGDCDRSPDVYVTTRVNFGDRPAGCIAQTALRETAKLYGDISSEAASKLMYDSYCDDIVSGGVSLDDVNKLATNMGIIVEMGGFSFKDKIVSGQDLAEEDGMRKVLGLCWYLKGDALGVDVHVNLSQKKRGVREGGDVSAESLMASVPVLTKRHIWRVVLSQFDLLGLVSVYMVQLKLIMRSLSGMEGQKIGWDDPVPDSVKMEFMTLVQQLYDLKSLRFPRAVVPSFSIEGLKPRLVAFGDGSQTAYCALVYICWQHPCGEKFCRLVAGKTRVAPLKKISVPRLELMGALLSTRLMTSVQQSLGFDLSARYFLTDSAAVLGMIKNESSSMKEFVGTRTGEIRSKTDVSKEWFWVPTDQNLADMGTRSGVSISDMAPGSKYQEGLPWMTSTFEEWPVRESMGKIPEEEVVVSVRVLHAIQLKTVLKVEKFTSFKKFVRIVQWICSWRWSQLTGKRKSGLMNQEGRTCTESLIFSQFQQMEGLHSQLERFAPLRPKLIGLQSCFGSDVPVVVVVGRVQGALLVGYDRDGLPLLTSKSPLSKLIMRDAHVTDHSGLDRTVQRSREVAWIVQGRRIAKSVIRDCFECKRRSAVLQKQVMAPLSEHRLPPTPVFGSTAVDLFGPLKIRDSVKRRVSRDCWGVLFVCTVTSAIHLELSEDYSCDAFLLCLKRFINLRGFPRRFQSDPGTQLVAAASLVKNWDFSQVLDWARGQQIEWKIVPTNSQHYNGCAEAMVKITKKHLEAMTKNLLLTYGEMTVFFSDVMQIVNSRPLMRSAGSDVFSGGPITPLHLIGGRASIHVPQVTFDKSASLTRRLKFLEETKTEFWNKWFAQVFPHLVPSYRWKKRYRNVQVGDVVLVQDASLLSCLYKLAVVKEVKTGVDGHVRTVRLVYKNVSASKDLKNCKFMETERSIHKIAVIVPVDWKQEDLEAAIMEDLSLDEVEKGADKTSPVGGSV